MPTTKKTLLENASIEQLQAQIAALAAKEQEQGTIELAKGRGYLTFIAPASEMTYSNVRYPVVALMSMGVTDIDKVVKMVEEINTSSKQWHIPVTRENRNIENDSTGVSNLPPIITRKEGAFIGKTVKLVLPTPVNKGGPRGREQRYALCRMNATVPLAGFALLQFNINKLATDATKKITQFYGRNGRVLYAVPDTEAEIEKMLAKSEIVTPTGTAGAGQG